MLKVGDGMGQGPATEVTHRRLNQPPVFSSAGLWAEEALTGKLFPSIGNLSTLDVYMYVCMYVLPVLSKQVSILVKLRI